MPRALSIAGSDSGGGAGIQADLKSFTAFGVYGMTVVTAVTAQNTTGVQSSLELPLDIVEAQMRSVAGDIGVDATKTGMLSSRSLVDRVASLVQELELPNLVVDTVMIAKGGHPLLAEDAVATLRERMLPLARVVTPNLPEAGALIGRTVHSLEDARKAARALRCADGQWVVVKGGHLEDAAEAIDIVFDGDEITELRSPRYLTRNTHGTGCTFSAAITAGLAQGHDPLQAIQRAKAYVDQAIRHALSLGSGHGPTNHQVGMTTPWSAPASAPWSVSRSKE